MLGCTHDSWARFQLLLTTTTKMDVGLVVLVLPNTFKFVLKPKQWKSINGFELLISAMHLTATVYFFFLFSM